MPRAHEQKRLLEATELALADLRAIAWTVHLANRKGTARRVYHSGPGFRNHATNNDVADRELIIDPGPRTVQTPGERRLFDTGYFRSTGVPLGEIAMETTGPLRVLGGFGHSGSDPQQPRLTSTKGHRADNSHWFDDISDGPVSVRIELNDRTIAVSSAWVIVAPPDFAPGVKNLITLYDAIYDLAVRRGVLTGPTSPPNRPSFQEHIQPILVRMQGYRWVNRFGIDGFFQDGISSINMQGEGEFRGLWEKLADPSSASSKLRTSFVSRLRNPDYSAPTGELNPLAYIPRLRNIRRGRTGADDVVPLTVTQYKIMQAWAEGNFVNNLGQSAATELLPDLQTRMALDSCVGGAWTRDRGITRGPLQCRSISPRRAISALTCCSPAW